MAMTTKELLALLEEERLARVGYDCSPGTVRWQRVCEAHAAVKDAAYAALPALCAEVEAKDALINKGAVACINEAKRADAAEAQVEALRKDAERYRWLAGQAKLDSWGLDYELPTVCAIKWMPGSEMNQMHESFDAAIDAARSRNEHEG